VSAEERNDQLPAGQPQATADTGNGHPLGGGRPSEAETGPPPSGASAARGAGRRQGEGAGSMHGGLIGSGEKPKNFKKSLKRLLGRLRPERTMLIIVILLAVVSVTCSVAAPKILAQATNLIFSGSVSKQLPAGVTQEQAVELLRAAGKTNQANMLAGMTNIVPGQGVDFAAVGRVLLIVTAIYLLASLFGWLQGYLVAGVIGRVTYKLRQDVDQKLARLPLKYFDSHPRGDILSRVTNDIDNIQQAMQQTVTSIITSILTLIGVLAMMFWISPLLAVICLITVPISIAVTVLIAKRSQKQFTLQWERTGALSGHVEETFTGHTIVKVFGRQNEAIAVFDQENERLYQASFKAQFISSVIWPAMLFIGNLQYVAIAVVGGLRVATGAMSLGDVQAFIQYSQQFSQPITQVASVANVLQSAMASSERVFELLDETEQSAEPARPVVLERVTGHLELKDVSFRYLPDVALIDDLNVEVQPGQTVAIVGPTGAGKTTLVNLLMRFYEIDKGEILIDGVDTRKMTREGLRRLFGMVLQDAWLFSGSIRENIAYGKEGATETQIQAAAEAAHVDHFVRTLPDGYDTRLDDDSSSVSQGERQLLTIARAFLADPEILILDEATSSVDTRTEVLIQKAMAKLLTGRTSFVIAHRLSTIRGADLILVMNDGQVVEQGTHEQLLAARGFYYDLYNSQFAGALAEAS
jgi:ATP-binding cassette subfamily B multidrug efflux pump